MRPYKLPLKFIGLWVLNLAVLLALSFALGIHDFLINTLHMSPVRDLTWQYLTVAAILASLEEWLMDKLKGNT